MRVGADSRPISSYIHAWEFLCPVPDDLAGVFEVDMLLVQLVFTVGSLGGGALCSI